MGRTRRYKPEFKKSKASKKRSSIKRQLKSGDANYSESFERFTEKKKK